MTPEIQGHGVKSHLRCSRTSSSQMRMLTAKKIVVYFDSMPIPKASPIASHQAPRPVCWSLASVSSRKVVAISTGLSGVAKTEPTAMASVRLK